MEKAEENLNLVIMFNLLAIALNLFIFMFLISAGPILMNYQIEFIKTLFPELPGVSINYPTVPEISQSLIKPIIALSSGGIFITISLILIFVVYTKLNPNKIYSFIDPKRKHFLFYGYVLIAGFLLFIGLADAISIGINTLIALSILISVGIFCFDAFIGGITPGKESYNIYLQGR